jgi:hypothetical protein
MALSAQVVVKSLMKREEEQKGSKAYSMLRKHLKDRIWVQN